MSMTIEESIRWIESIDWDGYLIDIYNSLCQAVTQCEYTDVELCRAIHKFADRDTAARIILDRLAYEGVSGVYHGVKHLHYFPGVYRTIGSNNFKDLYNADKADLKLLSYELIERLKQIAGESEARYEILPEMAITPTEEWVEEDDDFLTAGAKK